MSSTTTMPAVVTLDVTTREGLMQALNLIELRISRQEWIYSIHEPLELCDENGQPLTLNVIATRNFLLFVGIIGEGSEPILKLRRSQQGDGNVAALLEALKAALRLETGYRERYFQIREELPELYQHRHYQVLKGRLRLTLDSHTTPPERPSRDDCRELQKALDTARNVLGRASRKQQNAKRG